jgi:hypothetical protein
VEGLIYKFITHAEQLAERMAARAFISPAGEPNDALIGAPRGKPRGNRAFALIQVHKGGAVYAAFFRCQA